MTTSCRFLAAAAVLAALPPSGHALTGITDRPGDFLATFAGSASSTDLDVISASVFYNAGTDQFTLVSTMGGGIGSTPSGLYVWGVNRGSGTAGFVADGIDGVRFDRVVILRPDGSGAVAGAGALPAGSVTINGNTITGVVSGALLPGTGFAKLDYTWNLWPRDGAFAAGFTQIADFAPDNANFTTTLAVPEPAAAALLLAGLAGLALRPGARRPA